MILNNRSGFTLVEVVVVGILVAVLAGAGFAIFFVLTRETSETATAVKAQIQADILYETMARKTREANYILPPRGTAVPDSTYNALYRFRDSIATSLRRDTLFLFKSGSLRPFAGFAVRDTTIESSRRKYMAEWIPTYGTGNNSSVITSGSWSPFRVSGSLVLLDSTGRVYQGSSNRMRTFQMMPGQSVTSFKTNMIIRVINTNIKDTLNLSIPRGEFVCRT